MEYICNFCGREFLNGESVISYQGSLYCGEDCLVDDIIYTIIIVNKPDESEEENE